jgi:hypothetical protein
MFKLGRMAQSIIPDVGIAVSEPTLGTPMPCDSGLQRYSTLRARSHPAVTTGSYFKSRASQELHHWVLCRDRTHKQFPHLLEEIQELNR